MTSTAVEHFQYRSTQYVVRPELKNFIEFAASKHYSPQDAETIQLVRRAVDELINDPAIRVSVNIIDEPNADIQPANALRETYTAFNGLLDTSSNRLISFMLVSGQYVNLSDERHFVSISSRKHRLMDFSEFATAKYVGGQPDREVCFPSIFHQLQMLVSSISNKVVFFERYSPHNGRYYLVGCPIREEGKLDAISRFQVVIVLQLPVAVHQDTALTSAIQKANEEFV